MAVVVALAAALLTACGRQAPEASDDCRFFKPGAPSDNCADAQPGSPDTQGGERSTFDAKVGRIAMSADGNQHDNDDWASAPMALAILAHRNLQANLVHYDF